MKFLLEVNRKRILPFPCLPVLCLFLLLSSIYLIKMEQGRYLQESLHVEISDGTEYRYLMEETWYDDTKVEDLIAKYDLPQENLIKEDIDIDEFLPVESVNDALLRGKKPRAQGFFEYRMNLIKKAGQAQGVKPMDRLLIGYCEGWKVLLRNFDKLFYAVALALILLLVPVMREDERFKTKDLVEATLYGKKKLFQARLINGLEIGAITYVGGVALFSLLVLFIYGSDGRDLFIQNSREFFFFPIQVTYLQYFIYKFFNGLALTFCLVFLFLFLGDRIKDVKVSFSLILAYASIHFLLQSLWTSPGTGKLLFLSPLSLINIESLRARVSSPGLESCYLLSLIIPIIYGALLWIGLWLEKRKSFGDA
ncbi:hypothetical protein [Aedoeadaptatus coli]|uniref:hypothetical protein n=1 Tax=Aedoeadaptatus coli TaxID=2058292 RepID=UPI000D551737|nr:hypothetical protein [Peptoniphilus coli]